MTPDAPADQQPADPTPVEGEQQTPEQQPEELGEGGTNALKAVRAERDRYKAQLRDLQSKQSGEQQAEPVDPEQAANDRVTNHVRTHALRAAATAADFHNPDDLFTYLTPEQVESITVDENDNADPERVRLLVKEVLSERFYLSNATDHRGAGIGAVGSTAPKAPTLDDQYGPKR